jgi:transcriptional regulator with GAF, ATPase, and Fis domain
MAMTLRAYHRAFERALLVHHLAATGGNRTHAARHLGICRTYMGRLVRRHGLAAEFPGKIGGWDAANRANRARRQAA